MINDIWFAGVIDSDGFISINKHKRNGKDKYIVKVGMVWKRSSLTEVILKAIHVEYGGHLTYEIQKNNLGTSDCIRWRAEAKMAEIVLIRILPHLVLKKQEAELCLTLRNMVDNKIKYRQQNEHLSEKIFHECRELKKLH